MQPLPSSLSLIQTDRFPKRILDSAHTDSVYPSYSFARKCLWPMMAITMRCDTYVAFGALFIDDISTQKSPKGKCADLHAPVHPVERCQNRGELLFASFHQQDVSSLSVSDINVLLGNSWRAYANSEPFQNKSEDSAIWGRFGVLQGAWKGLRFTDSQSSRTHSFRLWTPFSAARPVKSL